MSGGRYESRGEVAAPNLIVSSTRVKDAPFGFVRVDKVPDDVLESWEMRERYTRVRWQRRRAGNERSAPSQSAAGHGPSLYVSHDYECPKRFANFISTNNQVNHKCFI